MEVGRARERVDAPGRYRRGIYDPRVRGDDTKGRAGAGGVGECVDRVFAQFHSFGISFLEKLFL